MKRQIFISIIFLSSVFTMKAQTWSGSTPGNIYYNQGNVGIGVNSPEIKLTTKSNYTPGSYLAAINTLPSDNSSGGLYIGSIQTDNSLISSGGTYYNAGKWKSKGTSVSAVKLHNGSVSFIAQNGLIANEEFIPTSRMIISNNGNVGIGTNNPSSKLEVNGDISLARMYKIKFLETVNGNDMAYIRSTYGQNGEDYNSLIFAVNVGDESMIIKSNGNVGIGITSPGYKLDVAGTIHTQEVKVDMNGWSDFVFHPTYTLRPLQEVHNYIQQNGHLPEIPTAKEVEENGISLGEMNAKLLQKIEELTLYVIDMDNELQSVKNENKILQEKINVLETKKQ